MRRFISSTGDKEFITRIQLSQLVTQDPYASDFYAQVFTQIARQRNLQNQSQGNPDSNQPGVLSVGPDGRGIAVGGVMARNGGGGRQKLKDTAMQRMTMQVKRIVEHAKERSAKAPAGECQLRSSTTL